MWVVVEVWWLRCGLVDVGSCDYGVVFEVVIEVVFGLLRCG